MPIKPIKPEPVTKVIFRVLKADGQVIALFPRLPGTDNPASCLSYMHTGQHGAASMSVVLSSRMASRSEYNPLLRELRSIGYRLSVRRKATRADFERRQQLIEHAHQSQSAS